MKHLASALVCLIPLLISTNVMAKDASVPFVGRLYENPQPSDPIFAHTWPRLIEEHNRAEVEGFLHMRPTQGKNFDLYLDAAKLRVPGGEAAVSIYSGPFAGCRGMAAGRADPHAIICPAHLTVYRDGSYKTVDIGTACRVGTDRQPTQTTSARTAYDAASNSIHLYAVIDGKRVERTSTDESCDRIIPLPQ